MILATDRLMYKPVSPTGSVMSLSPIIINEAVVEAKSFEKKSHNIIINDEIIFDLSNKNLKIIVENLPHNYEEFLCYLRYCITYQISFYMCNSKDRVYISQNSLIDKEMSDMINIYNDILNVTDDLFPVKINHLGHYEMEREEYLLLADVIGGNVPLRGYADIVTTKIINKDNPYNLPNLLNFAKEGILIKFAN